MNKIVGRILLGALAVSIPVGGVVYYFASGENDDKNNNIVEKKDNGGENGSDKDKKDNKDNKDNNDKKDDNVKHPSTDVKLDNPQKEKIERLRDLYHNDEIVGVVSIPSTSFSSIVVQHSDNSYYLDHNLFKSKAIEGSTYLDYRVDINSGKKNIIYGHNGDSSQISVPFSELEKYYEYEYFKNNQFITLEDENGVGTYQIFSVYVETSDPSYMYLNFKSDTSWLEHINYLKNKSLYNTGVSVDATDEVLILQTCSHNEKYIKYKDRYLLVVAKRVRYE